MTLSWEGSEKSRRGKPEEGCSLMVEMKEFLIMATVGGTSLGAPLKGPPDFLGGDELETGLGNPKPPASASMLR